MESQILGALHIGFSLQEIKRLTIPEVLRFCDLSAPPDPDEPRMATQEDIDRLLG